MRNFIEAKLTGLYESLMGLVDSGYCIINFIFYRLSFVIEYEKII